MQEIPRYNTTFSNGDPIGAFTVSGEVTIPGSTYQDSPAGGDVAILVTGQESGLTQTLQTEAGRQYQIVFQYSGDFDGVTGTHTEIRVTAGGEGQEFIYEESADWATSNLLLDPRTLTFTADSSTTDLNFSLLETGVSAVIGDIQVIEIPAAVTTILNNDATLSYDAATQKFYRFVDTPDNFDDALADATGSELGGVNGQLVTIRSQYENDLVRQYVLDGGQGIWLGTFDTNDDGNWNWLEGGVEGDEEFWSGGNAGGAAPGFFAPSFGQSNIDEDHARINSDGNWADSPEHSSFNYIIEWDATEVLSNFTFSLTDDAGGRFAIDSNTGEITVADGSLLDYETATTHNIGVQTTDAAGNSYSETMAITVDNIYDANQTVPAAQSIDEDTLLTFTSGTATEVSVTDGEGGIDAILRVTLSVNDGVLNLSQLTNLTIIEGADGSSSLVLEGTESDLNAALDGLEFTPDADFNGSVALNVETAIATTVVDLEGFYTFDGGNADDQAAGIANDGSLVNGALIVNDPSRGEVLSLDGTGAAVSIDGRFGDPQDVTLATFVNLNAYDTSGSTFISLGDGVILWATDDNRLRGTFSKGSSIFNPIFADVDLTSLGWTHVAYTIDSTTNVQRLYLNGKLVSEGNSTDSIVYDNAGKTQLGGRIGTTTSDVDGLLDDARIYTRALSADEIALIAAEGDRVSEDVAITVAPVNDAPDVVGPGSALLATEQTALNIHGAGFSVADVDATSGTMTATFTVGEGTFEIVAGNSGVTIDANTSGTVSFTGTLAQINSLITGSSDGTIIYNNSSNSPSASTSITLTVNDGGNTGSDPGATADESSEEDSATQTINIEAVNDDPTNNGSLPANVTVLEDVASNVDLSDVDLRDVDGSGGQTLSIKLSTTGAGNLYATSSAGVTVVGDGTSSLTLSGVRSALNNYLDIASSVQYLHATEHTNGAGADTITVAANDNGNTGTGGGTDQVFGSVSVDITAVNDAPELVSGGGIPLVTITEDDVNNNGQTVSDILDDGAGGSFFSDVDGDPEGIAITINNSGNGDFEYSTDNGSTWTAIGTVDNNNALLLEADDRIRFVPDGKNGQGSGLNIGFRAWDGTEGAAGTKYDFIANGNSGGSNGFSTQTRSALQTVTSVNDAPVLDNSGDVALNTQAEDAGAPSGAVGTLISDLVSLDAGSGNVTDVDNSATTGVAITGADTTNGTYFYSTNGGSTWIALGSVSDSSARVLRADSNTRIYFQSDQDYNGTVEDAITFRAWDRTQGSAGTLQDASTNGGTSAFSSDTETADITVTAVNDAPVVTPPVSAYSFTEQGSLAIQGTGFSIDDVDDNGGQLTAIFTVGEGRVLIDPATSGVTVSAGNSTDTVTFSGTKAQINALLDGTSGTITYLNDQTAASDTPSASTTITLTINDQGNTGSDPGDSGDATSEEDAASQTINITSVNDAPTFLGPELVSNGDFGNSDLAGTGWTTTGAAVVQSGQLNFGGSNATTENTLSQTINTVDGETYTLSFNYRDRSGGTNTLNQSLVVSVDGIGNLLTTEAILTDTDDQMYVRYTFTFTADSATSTIKFTDTSADPDSMSSGSESNDGRLDNISVKQTDGNLSSVTYVEDSTPVVLDADLLLFDAEISTGLDDYSGTTLVLQRNGGQNSDDVFSATGNLVFDGSQVKFPISGTEQVIATLTNSDGTLSIQFTNASLTEADINEILQSITYSNTNQAPPSSVQIDWSFNDNNDNSQGTGGAEIAVGSTTVNITAVNDAASIDTGLDFLIGDFDGSNSVTAVGRRNLISDNLIAIDADQTYDLSVIAEATNIDPSETHFIGFQSYDSDGLVISANNVGLTPGSARTTLAVDLVAGATEIVLTDATGWFDGAPANGRSLAYYGYTNSDGFTYDDYTYTRNLALELWDAGDIDFATNTITLNSAWSGPTLLAGEAVGNAQSQGGTFQYPLLSNGAVSDTPTTFTATIGGGTSAESGNILFRPGTAFIAPLVLANFNDTSTELTISDFSVTTTTGTTVFTEDGGPIAIIDEDFAITDPDDTHAESVTITLTNGRVGDTFIVDEAAINALGISVSGIPAGNLSADGSITLTLTSDTANSVTFQDYNDALAEITFDNNNQDPDVTDRTLEFVVNDGDEDSAAETLIIKVNAVDDAPVVSTTPLDPTFTENGSSVSVFSGTTIDTVEAGDLVGSFEISISGVADGASEQYRINGEFIDLVDGNAGVTDNAGFDYSITVNAGVATVTISRSFGIGGPTVAALINNSAYQNTSEAPTGTTRTVTLESVTEFEQDGVNDTTIVGTESVITITAVNDAPISVDDPTDFEASVQSNGPVGYWRLGESAGTTAADSSGNGNDGTYDGVTLGVAGAPPTGTDTAVDFDGTNDSVDLGTFDVDGTGITLSAYINVDDFDNHQQRIISKAESTGSAQADDHWWMLSTDTSGGDNVLRFRLKAGGVTDTLVASTGNIAVDQWHFVAATYDEATGTMKIYLNGVEVGSGTHSVGGEVSQDNTKNGIVTAEDFPTFAYWFENVTVPEYVDLRDPVGINGQDFTVFLNNFGKDLFPEAQSSSLQVSSEGEGELQSLMRTLLNPVDVNGDGSVSAADALNVVNEIARNGSGVSVSWSKYDAKW